MGAPVARMGRTPDPHPLHVHRPAKVVPAPRPLPPAPPPPRPAGRPAGRPRAVLLPSAIAHVGGENLPAGQALGLALVGHRSPVGTHVANPSSIPTNRPTSPPPTEGKAEENKILEIRCPKKTDRRMNSIFRLTDLHGNQLAADIGRPLNSSTARSNSPSRRGSRIEGRCWCRGRSRRPRKPSVISHWM